MTTVQSGKISKRLRFTHRIAELFDTRLPYFKGSRRVQQQILKLIAPKLEIPCTVPTRYGFDVTVASATDNIDWDVYHSGTYEPGTLHVIGNCLRQGDIFLDVGANIGIMSLFASKLVGENGIIYAFEPNPPTYELLQQNILRNQASNIKTFDIGLGVRASKETIFDNEQHNRGMASFIKRQANATTVAEVQVQPLDIFVQEQGLNTIRMLKIDVEGWELNVLKGAEQLLRRTEAPIICAECNTSLPGHRDIYEFVTATNHYQGFMPDHGNGRIARLKLIEDKDALPKVGSPNLYFFLAPHLYTLNPNLFS